MTQREIDILSTLCESDSAMSLADILNARPDLIKSTVAATLAKLLKEKLIEVNGIAYSGKVLCRTYRPTPASKDKVLISLAEDYNTVRKIVPQSDFIASILRLDEDKDKAKEEIAKLRAMLDNFEVEYHLK